MNIAILLFDQVDLLDSGGPYEVFLTASRLVERDGGDTLFRVSTVTMDGQPVTAYGGLGLVPDGNSDDLMSADVLIVPGTIDIQKAVANKQLISTIAEYAASESKSSENIGSENIVASVCTGAFLLAEANLLTGRDWTTHWEDVDLLTEKLTSKGAKRGVRWVDSGSVVTAAGLSSGIDMALHLVERLAGLELAERTAKQIDYKWEAATNS